MSIRGVRFWSLWLMVIMFVGGLVTISYSQEDEKTKIAVFPFKNATTRAEEIGYGDSIAEMLVTAFQRGGSFIIVERSRIDLILKEQELGAAGITQQAIELGKNLGVNLVVTGGVTQFTAGSRIEIDIRLIDATDGKVITALDDMAKNEDFLRDTVNRLAQKIEREYLGGLTGILAIFSEPLGATVIINGEERGKTPLRELLAEGEYQIELELTDYEPHSEMVKIEKGKGQDLSVALTSKLGFVSISSTPPGASVYLDGIFKGNTPLAISRLEPGDYMVELRYELHESWRQNVPVSKNKRTQINVVLKASSSAISITSFPSAATIFLDGSEKGQTPLVVEGVPLGGHTLLLAKKDYQSWEEGIQVEKDKRMEVSARLKALPSLLQISAIPTGATISLNDVEKGGAPLTIGDLSEGIYRVRATRWGYKDALQNVTLGINEVKNLDLQMEEEIWKVLTKWGGLGGGIASGLGAFLSFQGAVGAYDQYQIDDDPAKMGEHINQVIMFNVFTGVLGATSGALLVGSVALFVW